MDLYLCAFVSKWDWGKPGIGDIAKGTNAIAIWLKDHHPERFFKNVSIVVPRMRKKAEKVGWKI